MKEDLGATVLEMMGRFDTDDFIVTQRLCIFIKMADGEESW